ncbi:MAG: hypothetical protein IJH04_02700 [Eggerthellaceae bacterium]|nr:hypothetical protein [Eggerthellaceae bacterium]
MSFKDTAQAQKAMAEKASILEILKPAYGDGYELSDEELDEITGGSQRAKIRRSADCPACGETMTLLGGILTPSFCPHCGAWIKSRL